MNRQISIEEKSIFDHLLDVHLSLILCNIPMKNCRNRGTIDTPKRTYTNFLSLKCMSLNEVHALYYVKILCVQIPDQFHWEV